MSVDAKSPNGAAAPSANGNGGPPEPPITRRQRRRNRIPLLIVLALTLIGVGTAIYDVFAPATEEPLDAHSHTAVQHACDAAFHSLKALPPLTRASTRAQLEARILEENGIFSTMVDKFVPLRPPDRDGRVALEDWTKDWRAVLHRRASYVQQLRATPRHVDFVVPIDPAGAPVTDRMNQYSRTHNLNQCLTQNLQFETVDTIRQYPNTDTVSG